MAAIDDKPAESTPNDRHFCTLRTPDDLPEGAQQLLQGRKAALLNEYRWKSGNPIKVGFRAGSQALRDRVRAAAEGWIGPKMANLKFVWGPAAGADVRIDFISGDGSWSYIGTFCHQIPSNEPTMNFGWLTDASKDHEVHRVVLHEFGHAIGLIHEHQNPKKPIKWNVPAVKADLGGPPNNWDDATIRHNMFDKYQLSKVTATTVDPKSIMMYPIPASWTLDGFSAGMNERLSRKDRSLIRKAYPHP